MENCIFCKITSGEISTEKIFEDDKFIALNDINPKAKIHILIVPKRHIESIKTLEEGDKELMGDLFLVAKKVAHDKNMEGYKLLFNVGREGGQMIDHLHLHLLSGEWKAPT
jgi:histidine triad (HIT) family protein